MRIRRRPDLPEVGDVYKKDDGGGAWRVHASDRAGDWTPAWVVELRRGQNQRNVIVIGADETGLTALAAYTLAWPVSKPTPVNGVRRVEPGTAQALEDAD